MYEYYNESAQTFNGNSLFSILQSTQNKLLQHHSRNIKFTNSVLAMGRFHCRMTTLYFPCQHEFPQKNSSLKPHAESIALF